MNILQANQFKLSTHNNLKYVYITVQGYIELK